MELAKRIAPSSLFWNPACSKCSSEIVSRVVTWPVTGFTSTTSHKTSKMDRSLVSFLALWTWEKGKKKQKCIIFHVFLLLTINQHCTALSVPPLPLTKGFQVGKRTEDEKIRPNLSVWLPSLWVEQVRLTFAEFGYACTSKREPIWRKWSNTRWNALTRVHFRQCRPSYRYLVNLNAHPLKFHHSVLANQAGLIRFNQTTGFRLVHINHTQLVLSLHPSKNILDDYISEWHFWTPSRESIELLMW